MNQRIGQYIDKKMPWESFKAYVPPKLPPHPPLDLLSISPLLEKATLAVGELKGVHKLASNAPLLALMSIRKEALFSSKIEGIHSSPLDLILFEHPQKNKKTDYVEEVFNNVEAIRKAHTRFKEGFPLSLRLLKEMHGILLRGKQNQAKLPGEFRRSQNWIGGTRPGNASYVPPPVEYLHECLGDFEKFLHDKSLPALIKAGVAHVQFESIHPFLDGNGRIGRLLINLVLCADGIIEEPILYLSLFLEKNRELYYQLLQEVHTQGRWEVWLEFFLEGVYFCAKQAIQNVLQVNALFEQDLQKIQILKRARFSCEKAFEYLKQYPQVTALQLADTLQLSKPAARSALDLMTSIGILNETSGKKRDMTYTYSQYLSLLQGYA